MTHAASTDNPIVREGLARLRDDIAYWSESCFRIRDKRTKIVPMRLNPAQLDLMRRERDQIRRQGSARQYVLKARQGGFTTYAQMRSLHLIWSRTGIDALTVADKQDRTDKVFAITDRAITHFPPALLPELGKARAKEISFPNLDSHFYTDTAGSGDPARGMTLGRLHCSEFAHFAAPRSVLAAAVPAVVTEGGVVMLETTASMYDDEAHVFWREAQEGATDYEPIFYPWWECDPVTYRLPLMEPDELGKYTEEETFLVKKFALVPEQIKWRRKQIRDFTYAFFMREYAENPDTCWMASGAGFYEVELLKWLMDHAPDLPTSLGTLGEHNYRTDLPPNNRMIIGGDVAEGGAGDRSTWEAQAFPSGVLMSTFSSARITPERFADKLNAYARRFGFPILVIEKNSHGITVLRRLIDVHRYPRARLFHRLSYSRDAARPTKEIGWLTSGETKPLLLDAMRERFVSAKEGVAPLPSKAVLRDALSIHYDKNGDLELTGRDAFVASALAVLGRQYPLLPLGHQFPPTILGPSHG